MNASRECRCNRIIYIYINCNEGREVRPVVFLAMPEPGLELTRQRQSHRAQASRAPDSGNSNEEKTYRIGRGTELAFRE